VVFPLLLIKGERLTQEEGEKKKKKKKKTVKKSYAAFFVWEKFSVAAGAEGGA